MRKIASLIVAITFALSIVLAVVNTAATNKSSNSKNAYTAIIPVPPPQHPDSKKKAPEPN